MAVIHEFEIPKFLSNSSVDEIHGRMLNDLPANMDRTAGGFPWDLTHPNALLMSELVEFVLVEALKSMYPMWAEGVMLDYQGQNRGLMRKSAEYATGAVTITGTAGYVIEAGTVVTTTGINEIETILFKTLEEAVIGDDGTVEVNVRAVTIGALGNVAAGRIDRFDVPNENVISVINAKPTTGGTDTESDDDYRNRLVDYDIAQGESFIGSVADYKRWAMSINGVGGATVIPAQDTSGTVQIVLADVYGKPASAELCKEVYDYIMHPDDEAARLAPINAVLKVIAPEEVTISINAKLVLDGTRTLAAVKEDFIKRVNAYYMESIGKGVIVYNKIASILVETDGVADHSELTVNSGKTNISIDGSQFPSSTDATVVLRE